MRASNERAVAGDARGSGGCGAQYALHSPAPGGLRGATTENDIQESREVLKLVNLPKLLPSTMNLIKVIGNK